MENSPKEKQGAKVQERVTGRAVSKEAAAGAGMKLDCTKIENLLLLLKKKKKKISGPKS